MEFLADENLTSKRSAHASATLLKCNENNQSITGQSHPNIQSPLSSQLVTSAPIASSSSRDITLSHQTLARSLARSLIHVHSIPLSHRYHKRLNLPPLCLSILMQPITNSSSVSARAFPRYLAPTCDHLKTYSRTRTSGK